VAQQALNAITLGSIYVLFSLGLSLAWGVANILNLAHSALFVIGALVSYEIAKVVALPLVIMLPLAALAGGLGAVALDVLAFTPITKRARNAAKRELAIVLASLGAAAIVVNVGNVRTNYMIQAIPTKVYGIKSYEFLGLRTTNVALIVLCMTAVAAGAVVIWLRRSAHGRAVRAVAFDRDLAPLFGVNSTRLSRFILFLGGALAGAAGLLLAIQLSGFDPYFANSLMLKAFAIVIIGGIGSIGGTVIAAYALAAVETAIIAYAPGGVPFDAVAFAIIILVLILRPQGIAGVVQSERA
jgi:branched-chain amino acid transport system permease protein